MNATTKNVLDALSTTRNKSNACETAGSAQKHCRWKMADVSQWAGDATSLGVCRYIEIFVDARLAVYTLPCFVLQEMSDGHIPSHCGGDDGT